MVRFSFVLSPKFPARISLAWRCVSVCLGFFAMDLAAHAGAPPVADSSTANTVEESPCEITLTGHDDDTHFGALADYTRQGAIMELSSTIIEDNLSGVTYNGNTGTLFMIRNFSAAAQVFEYTTLGGYLRTITEQNFQDTEAISWMYGNTFAIGEETNVQRISICSIDSLATTVNRLGNPSWTTSLGSLQNLGLECMCYNPEADRLYYCSEKPSAGHWYLYSMVPSTGVSSIVCDLQLPIGTSNLATDLSDMAYDRGARNLLLLSHESNKVIRINFAGTVLETLNGLGFTQAEGITISPDRKQLFICGEPRQFARYALPAATMTYAIASQPAHGTLLGLPPSLVYKPAANFYGTDTFTFVTNDGTSNSPPATVTVSVSNVNDAPTAQSQTLSTSEDVPLAITLAGLDPDADVLTFTITQQPAHGALSGSAPNLIWTPAANYYGTDSFAFTVSDGQITSAPATIQLTAVAVNDAPLASAQSLSTSEDVPKAVTLSGSDVEGSAITFIITTNPAHGALSGNAPNLIYTPAANFHGTDNFAYAANDGSISGLPAVVSVEVLPINDAPAAVGQSLAAAEDTPLAINLTGMDVDEEDVLSHAIVTLPAHGTLSGSIPNLVYTPALNFHGTDIFSFTVSDGLVTSAPANISLVIASVNDTPVASAQSVQTNEDTPLPVSLGSADADGDAVTFTVATLPAHGTLTGSGSERVYAPEPDFHGTDVFSYAVSDGVSQSSEAVVSITIAPVNDAPTASSEYLQTEEDTGLSILLHGADIDGDALSYSITTQPVHGTLSGTPPVLTYTPAPNFHGADSFHFKANDGITESEIAEIQLGILAVNDVPTANPQSVETDEDNPVAVVLGGNDADGDPLGFSVPTPPLHGSLSGTPPNLVYTPAPNFHGQDHFAFTAGDGTAVSPEAMVSVEVRSVNDAPVTSAQQLETLEDTALPIELSGNDADGDPLIFAIIGLPAHGTLSGSLPNVTYQPAENYNGDDSFTVRIFDGLALGNAAVIHLTVLPVNDAPVVQAQAILLNEDSSASISLTGQDVDGDTLSFTVRNQPLHGTLSGAAPDMLYTPQENYHGADSFSFSANDGNVDSNVAVIQLAIASVNDAPVASGRVLETAEDTSIPVLLEASDPDLDQLTFSIIEQPAHGTLSGTPPQMIYTPPPNFHGNDSFRFTATDGSASSQIATVQLTVTSVNDVPSADDLTLSTAEDVPVAATLLASDADLDSIAFTIVAAPQHGTLSGTAPNLTYTPDDNFHGSDSFSYTASDSSSTSAPAIANITIASVNDAPEAVAEQLSTMEDASLPLVLQGTDADIGDADLLGYSIITPPQHGTLTGVAPNLTYIPSPNFHGPDAFDFAVTDGALVSTPAMVSIQVMPENDAPSATAASLETVEDTAVPLVLSGTDADSDLLAFTIVEQPAHGTLSGTPPNLIYIPAANYHGTDSFRFAASDGAATSLPSEISINVLPENDVPVGISQSLSTNEDVPLPIELSAADADGPGDALTFVIVQQPLHGTLTGQPGSLVYVPSLDFEGSDEFKFAVKDGVSESPPAAIQITVNAVNDAPTGLSQDLVTDEDAPVPIQLAGADVESDALSFTVVTPPEHGTLSGSPPDLVYSPGENFHGTDQFFFKVGDGLLNSGPVAVVIHVSPVNDRPVASEKTVATEEDTAVAVQLQAADADEENLTFTVSRPPSHGSLSGALPNATYTPEPNFHGQDSFSFKANDGTQDSLEAAVSISISAVNDAPVASAQLVETSEDEPVAIVLSGADADMDALAFSITEQPQHGSLSGELPNVVYTPALNYHGPDSFRFVANDGVTNSEPAIVNLAVSTVNDLPIAVPQALSGMEDSPAIIHLSGTDADGDTLEFSITTQPLHGTLSGTSPNLTYAPAPNFHGLDTFSYRANDGAGYSEIVVVSISVEAVNDLPIASALSLQTDEDTVLAITLTASDVEMETLQFTIVDQPAHGSLSGSGEFISYVPNPDYHGPDVFTFSASDSGGSSVPVRIEIEVTSVNDVPVAAATAGDTLEDTPLSMTLTAADADMDALSYAITNQPQHGVVTLLNSTLIYTPNLNYHGPDQFRYAASDAVSTSASALVFISISPVNDAPVAFSQSASVAEDSTIGIVLSGEDVENDALDYMIVSQPLHGTLSGSGANITYVPDANYAGPDSFKFIVIDGSLASPQATVSLQITPVNDAPAAVSAEYVVTEDVPLGILLQSSDADGEPLSFALKTMPAHGTLSGVAPNLVYTPASNFSGSDSFIFTATDAAGERSEALVTLTILAANDAPVTDPQSLVTAEDSPVNIRLTGSDIENDAIQFHITAPPLHGTLTGLLPELIYTPDANFNGTDTFAFRAEDATESGASAMVQITVTSVNDAPETSFDVFSVEEDSVLSVTISKSILRNDADSHDGAPSENNLPLQATLVSAPPHAANFTLSPNGQFSYQPQPNFHGIDAFTYQATDSLGATSGIETVLIAVLAVNDAPVVAPLEATTLEDVSVALKLRSADADLLTSFDPYDWLGIPPPNNGPAPHDADPIFTIVAGPQHGTLTGVAPNLVYTPAPNFNGQDAFTYAASDGLATSLPATVSITVQADNDADLLPDTWELATFAALSYGAHDDPDGDGEDNAFELLAGSNGGNGNDSLKMEVIGDSPESGVFRLSAVKPGVRYILECTKDLEHWESVNEATYEAEGQGAISDPRPADPNARRCFYRVTIHPK